MPSIILTRGLPGCGKSTWAKALFEEFPGSYVRVNRDELREMLFPFMDDQDFYNSVGRSGREALVTRAEHRIMDVALKAGKNILVDETHLRLKYITEWQKFAAPYGARVEVKTFDVPLEVCLARNQKRAAAGGRLVPPHIIEDMAKRFLPFADVPTFEPEPVEQYPAQNHLPAAILVDIDGTVAQMNGRSPYDWSRVGEDAPKDTIIRLVREQYLTGKEIIFLSGRDGSCREQTEQWLTRYVGENTERYGIPWTLHMRPAGDQRSDRLVKREIFDREIRGKWDVLFVLDDRQQVVDMWRSMGLTCLQVAPGDF